MEPSRLLQADLRKRETLYRYEDWQGNNYVLFGGRLLLGSDAVLSLFTFFILIVPSIPFFRHVLPELQSIGEGHILSKFDASLR